MAVRIQRTPRRRREPAVVPPIPVPAPARPDEHALLERTDAVVERIGTLLAER